MPYTPPTSRSPAGSSSTSPAPSRRSSLAPTHHLPQSQASQKPELPRSTSYLTRHRRTPSVKTTTATTLIPNNDGAGTTPPESADREKDASALHASPSLRKSPPPVTDRSQLPTGLIISPPESAHNSSDDEESERGRKLRELQAAIRDTIEQYRASSPEARPDDLSRVNPGLGRVVPASDNEVKDLVEEVQRKLSPSARKISHSRSNTDSSVFISASRRPRDDTPITESSDDETDDSDSDRKKPPMVRKKSGELVRPALRPSRRPSSMPGTPTFSKAVHFDAHLEHIRHFLQVDRPLAVSAGSSPVESHTSDTEFPFSDDDANHKRSPPYEWEIILANFPEDTLERLQLPIRVERVFLSADNKTLIGSVAVANLAFHKTVVARFTLDYWKTTSEVLAEYTHDLRRKPQNDGYDRFNFNIKLADLANLETKTMFFCVKYCVNGVEYWDNNNNTNFQVDFKKKFKPMNGRKGAQGASSRQTNGLPRSNKTASATGRRAPPTFDDFADGFDASSAWQFAYAKPSHQFLTGNGRLKGVRSDIGLSSDRFAKKSANQHGHAFSNRYDFAASLSAAIQTDRSGISIKSSPKKQATAVPLATAAKLPVATAPKFPIATTKPTLEPAPPASVGGAIAHHTGSSWPGTANTEQLSLASPSSKESYNEFLDKYCFYGSVKNSPQLKDGTMNPPPGQYDGNDDGYVLESETSSPDNSSPLMMQLIKRPSTSRTDSAASPRSTSPAPMTSFVTGTSSMYPYNMHSGSMFNNEAHTPTAIRG